MSRFLAFYAPEGGDGSVAGGGGNSGSGGAPGGNGGGSGVRSLVPASQPTGQPTPVTGAVAETWWKGWQRDDGSLDHTRLSHLPQDRQDDVAILSRYKSLDDLAKALGHHARAARAKGAQPLREGATEKETTEYYEALAAVTGAPDKPEGYGLKKPDNVPAEAWDQPFVDSMTKVFHKHRLSPGAVKDIFAEYDKLTGAKLAELETVQRDAEEARFVESQKKLKMEFGAFAEEKFAAARRGAKFMGINIDQPPYNLDAQLIIGLATVGQQLAEARHIDSDSHAQQGETDPQKELNAMVSDPTHKYYDILRNPTKDMRKAQEAYAYQRKLGERIAAAQARRAQGAR